MAITIDVNNNIAAVNVRRHLNSNSKELGTRLERLPRDAHQPRHGRCGGPPSGFQGPAQAFYRPAQREMGSNLLQVTQGSLNEVSSVLIRIRELAVVGHQHPQRRQPNPRSEMISCGGNRPHRPFHWVHGQRI